MPQPTQFHGRLDGRVAIVTGAGAGAEEIGIGRAIAVLLGCEGASVVCVDLDAERAAETARLIEAAGGRALGVAGDVTSSDDCATIVGQAVAAWGRLDVLVNNVGIALPVSLDAFDLPLWNKVLATNLTSAALMSSAAVPEMARNGGGAIVNITSLAGIRTMGALAYGPSKAALHQLSCEMALSHGRRGIRVNSVAPGHMVTPLAARLMPAEMMEKRRKVSPLGIEGDAWDIAQAVLFLASDAARFITGVQLPVDGGVTMLGALAGAALLDT